MIEKKMVLKIGIFAVLVILLFSAIAVSFPKQDLNPKSDTALGSAGGKMYAAYVDYSSLVAKIKIIDLHNKTEKVLSDTNWDASHLKFINDWIMWTEKQNSEMRIIWYNAITKQRVVLNVNKNTEKVLYSAETEPTYCVVINGHAKIYAWNGNAFSPVKTIDTGRAHALFFEGTKLWYANDTKIYNGNATPVATFSGKITSIIVVNHTIFAAVKMNNNYDMVAYSNGTYKVIKSMKEKPYRIRGIEAGTTLYLSYCREVEHGDDDYTALTLVMISSQKVVGEKNYEANNEDYYKQSLTAVNGTVYMLYLTYTNRHWTMRMDSFAHGSLQKSVKIKELQTVPIYISTIFFIIGLFAFIFGMIPVEKRGKQIVKDDIPIHRFISYEPYMFFKPLTIIAGTLAMILGFMSLFYTYPDMQHRAYLPASIIALSTFYSLGYIFYFIKESRASPIHRAAYLLAIITLLINMWGIYMLLFYPPALIFNTVFMISSLSFILIITIAALTMIGLTRAKNTWLMIVGLLILSYKLFLDLMHISTAAGNFYPSPNSFYAMHGEAQLTQMFVGMVFFFMAVMLVLRIPREKFKPVSKWSKEEYLEVLEHAFIVSILGSVFLLITTIYMVMIFGPWGVLGVATNTTALSGIFGMVLGMSLFMAILGRKGVDQARQLGEELFLKPSMKMGAPLGAPLAIAMAGLIAGMFIGIFGTLFFVWSIYETFRAYRILKEKIEKDFKPVSEKELEKAKKEEELIEVPISREDMKEFIRKNALAEVKIIIGVSVIMLFLWKFIAYSRSLSHTPPPAEWITYGLLIMALIPLTAPPLFKNAIAKSKNLMELTQKSGWAESSIAIGIINIILVGFANGPAYLVILSLATSLLSLLMIYRYRTTAMLQKIDSFSDEDMKIYRQTYQYIQSYLHGAQKTSTDFKATGYTKAPEKINEEQETYVPEETEGRGKLLATEPEEYRVRREAKLKKTIIGIWALSILIPLPMFAFYDFNTAVTIVIGYAAFLALWVYALYSMRKRHLEPIKIYENGIEFQNYLGITAFFYYYGFKGKVIRGGKNIILKMTRKTGKVSRGGVAIPLWPEADALLPRILPKMSGEDVPVKIEIQDTRKYNEVYSKMFLVIFSALIFYSMLFIAIIMNLGLGLMVVPIFAAYIVYKAISISVQVPKRVFGKPPKINRSYVAIAVSIVFLLLVAGYAIPFNIESTYHAQKDMPAAGIEIISKNMTGTVMNVNKSIGFAGNILLRDVVLNVSMPNVGIYIRHGATVSMENVIIRGEKWSFESYGTLIARNSSFINIWGNMKHKNQQGGMEIYHSARFIHCTFENATTNAIMVFKANLDVEDSVIMNTGDEGIEGTYANITVVNTRFINTTWAITTFISHLDVSNGEFVNCSHGITLSDSSSGTVKNSKFVNCHVGIDISDASTLKTENIKYSNVDSKFIDDSRELNDTCLTITIPILLALLGLAYMRLKRDKS